MKRYVPGIRSIGGIEEFGAFDSEKVVKAVYDNQDIILKVENSSPKDDTDIYIDVYLNLKAKKVRLVDGILDLFKKFDPTSVDLEYNKTRGTTHGIRILKFYWDSHDRLLNI